MALGHVHIAVAWIGDDVVGLGQRFGGISFHAGGAQRHQHLAVGTELDDDAAFFFFARKFRALLRAPHARVGHPYVAVAVDVDAVRPHEHARAEAAHFFSALVEEMDRVDLGAETAGGDSRRAAVRRPNRLTVAIDGDAVGAAPRPFLQSELRPIADNSIRVRAAVERLHFVGLRGAGSLLRLNENRLSSDIADDRCRAGEPCDD